MPRCIGWTGLTSLHQAHASSRILEPGYLRTGYISCRHNLDNHELPDTTTAYPFAEAEAQSHVTKVTTIMYLPRLLGILLLRVACFVVSS
jgi:hypothetical protein